MGTVEMGTVALGTVGAVRLALLLLWSSDLPSTPSSLAELRALEKTVIATAAKVTPAIVFIDGGSGVLISPDGYIITNNHVIEGAVHAHRRRRSPGPAELSIRLPGGQPLRAAVAGRYAEPDGDLALLKTVNGGPFPYLDLGDSDSLRTGQWVLALGNPFLLGEGAFAFFAGPGDFSPSVSLGIVSALHRQSEMYPDAIQVDVAVNPGSSGGPLLTLDGKVVGITGKIQTRFLIEVNSGVGYALPSKQIARFLEPLKRAGGGVVRRGEILGLSLTRREALVVSRVAAGSPGERAGFRPGDRIVAIDGQTIQNRRRYDGLLATYPSGSQVVVQVRRAEESADIRAVLDPVAPARLGVRCEPRGGEEGGVRIRELVPEAPAARAGLRVGDVILRLDDQKIESVVDLLQAIGERRAGDTAALVILRGEKLEALSIRLDARDEE